MPTADILTRVRRNHPVLLHHVVTSVDIVVKDKTNRIEVFETNNRFGYNIFEFWMLESEPAHVLNLARYTKPDFTSADNALIAAFTSLGYRST